jgi:ribosomal protein S24E
MRMDLKVLSKKKNELLNRTELVAEMNEKTVPSKTEIRTKLSAVLNTPIETIAIQKVETKFGSPYAKIYARTYADEATLRKMEATYVITRNFGKEKKAEANPENAPPANFKK